MEDLEMKDNNYQEFTKQQLIARINFLEKLDKSYKALTENKNKLEEYENKECNLVVDLDYKKEYEINQYEITKLKEENEKYKLALLNICLK